VSELDDGRLRVVLRTPDTGWVRRLALRLGEEGRVISPSALAAEVRDAATAALENYVKLSGGHAPFACGNCLPPVPPCRLGQQGRLTAE
jgi:WYL domain